MPLDEEELRERLAEAALEISEIGDQVLLHGSEDDAEPNFDQLDERHKLIRTSAMRALSDLSVMYFALKAEDLEEMDVPGSPYEMFGDLTQEDGEPA